MHRIKLWKIHFKLFCRICEKQNCGNLKPLWSSFLKDVMKVKIQIYFKLNLVVKDSTNKNKFLIHDPFLVKNERILIEGRNVLCLFTFFLQLSFSPSSVPFNYSKYFESLPLVQQDIWTISPDE